MAEFLEATFGPKTAFSNEVAWSHQSQGYVVGNDRTVTMGDISEGPRVNQYGGIFQGLQQIGHHGVSK